MTTRYFAVIFDDRTVENPYSVFRYRTDDGGLPLGVELSEGEAWRSDVRGTAAAFIFNGEIGAEEITEAQAKTAIAAINAAPT